MIRRGSFGATLDARGGATFRLWAPAARSVALVGDATAKMQRDADGWYVHRVPGAKAGFRYAFRIDDELEVPDPASAFQPDDVRGRSELIDQDYAWRCGAWRGRPWHEAAFLELHVGTFTPEGTYRGVLDKLDAIVETGITAIELMPLGEFYGRYNWGYDGVLPYAPDSAYGRPEDLKALIDAAHERGLMVFLDVVYNHFGPEGNYLGRYAPQFFTAHHKTPWGDAVDYRVPQVRAFAIENALHWLTHYRFDGLRLDAVHAIAEPGEPHLLGELSKAVGAFARESGRHIHLVLENDDNRAALLDPSAEVPAGRYRAQWNDDYHHAWHVLLTGETRGYYVDYETDPVRGIARALQDGFVYQGEASRHRGGSARGEPSTDLPPSAFVNFIQNHDQIGNRAFNERLTRLAEPRAIQAALAVTLLAPSPPLLFMGEEWGTTQPFPYFCDFDGDLAEAVRRGRRDEFSAHFAGLAATEVPDPLAESTMRSAILDWDERTREPHTARLKLITSLLGIRRTHVVPMLARIDVAPRSAACEGRVIVARWGEASRPLLQLVANLGDEPARVSELNASQGGIALWGGTPGAMLAPWAVHWFAEAP